MDRTPNKKKNNAWFTTEVEGKITEVKSEKRRQRILFIKRIIEDNIGKTNKGLKVAAVVREEWRIIKIT